jgi:hypothetical protein
MEGKEIPNQDLAGENSFQVVERIEESPAKTSHDQVTIANEGLLWTPLYLTLIAWALLFLVPLNVWKSLRSKPNPLEKACKYPCLSCRFFENNHYLKCAVHPSKVLSTEANECPDYWSQKSNKFPC